MCGYSIEITMALLSIWNTPDIAGKYREYPGNLDSNSNSAQVYSSNRIVQPKMITSDLHGSGAHRYSHGASSDDIIDSYLNDLSEALERYQTAQPEFESDLNYSSLVDQKCSSQRKLTKSLTQPDVYPYPNSHLNCLKIKNKTVTHNFEPKTSRQVGQTNTKDPGEKQLVQKELTQRELSQKELDQKELDQKVLTQKELTQTTRTEDLILAKKVEKKAKTKSEGKATIDRELVKKKSEDRIDAIDESSPISLNCENLIDQSQRKPFAIEEFTKHRLSKSNMNSPKTSSNTGLASSRELNTRIDSPKLESQKHSLNKDIASINRSAPEKPKPKTKNSKSSSNPISRRKPKLEYPTHELVDIKNKSKMNYITLLNGKKISPPINIQHSTQPELIAPDLKN